MVSRGLNYISKTKIKRALKFVFGTWIIATLNYGKTKSKKIRNFYLLILGPAIFLWDWLPDSDPFQYRSCDPPFANNFPYLVTTAFVEFFVPFFSITTLNLLVYMNIRQRSRGLIRTNTITSNTTDSKSILSSQTTKLHNISSENGFNENTNPHNEEELMQINTSNNIPLPTSTTYSKSSSSLALARDRKAAKSLFILVFVFALCWCPYTLLTLIRALCKQPDKCISGLIYEITFWLLWLNSTINPLLYSFLHVKFRKAFYQILCFYRVRHRRRLRGHVI
jgi:histamine receptor H3